MKVLLIVASLAASVFGEAPSTSYGAPFRTSPSNSFGGFAEPPSSRFNSISPSASQPFGRQFFIPSGGPSSYYSSPLNEYGPPPPPPTTPAPTTTTEAVTTTEVPTTTEQDVDVSAAGAQSGVYYVLQSDGRVQRISYAHGPAPARLSNQLPGQQSPGYLARFLYHDLDPQGAPVYTYNAPQLVRINK